jgi:hypothetical protein
MSKTINQFKHIRAKSIMRVKRPCSWDEVVFRPVPLQEGEDGGQDEVGRVIYEHFVYSNYI